MTNLPPCRRCQRCGPHATAPPLIPDDPPPVDPRGGVWLPWSFIAAVCIILFGLGVLVGLVAKG